MSGDEHPPRLGIPVYGQRLYLTNVMLLASSGDEALHLLRQLHSDAHPNQVSDMTVDDVTFDQPVYMFDLDRPNITVDDFSLRCQIFGLGGAAHPAVPVQAKRSHLFMTTGDPETLEAHLSLAQHDRVFRVGSRSIEDTLEEVILYVLEHASIAPNK